MDELVQAMKKALADTFAFYLKAHGFHWNVEGRTFAQDHELFSTIYEEVYGSIDKFAEEIRTMDAYAPASFARFSELTDIEDEIKILTAQGMFEKLLADNAIVMASVEQAYVLAEAVRNHGLSNFLAERQDAHAKHGWMLRATLKQR
jgi:starvation-inducible DNA-binding protein